MLHGGNPRELREGDRVPRRGADADPRSRDEEGLLAAALLRRADLDYGRGRLAPALADIEEAIAWFEKHGTPTDIAEALLILGNIRATMGDPDRAREAYEDALALPIEGADNLVTDLDANLGVLDLDAGRGEEALERFQALIEAYEAADDLYSLAHALYQIGRAHALREESEDALAAWARVRELQPEFPVATYAAVRSAELHLLHGRTEAARPFVEAARREADRFGEWELLTETSRLQAMVCEQTGRPKEAYRHVVTALDYVTASAYGLPPTVSPFVRNRRTELFAIARRVTFAQASPSLALDLFERTRGATLVAHLRDAGYAPREEKKAGPSMRRAREAMQAAQQKLEIALRSGMRPEVRIALAARRKAQRSYRSALERQQTLLKREGGLAGAAPAALDEITAALRPKDALVLYAVSETRVHALVVQKTRVQALDLAGAAEVQAALDGLRCAMTRVQPVDAKTLRALLLDPLGLPADVEHLIVCPDGCLWTVPFCLLDRRKTVALTPSATAYALLAARAPEQGNDVLALGAPDYGTAPGTPRRRSPTPGHFLGALPGSVEEARRAAGETGVCLLGARATEGRWLEALAERPRWRAIHFACHGILDEEHPAWSALALTPDDENDGWLTALEVFGTRVPTDLVVLSACNTGRGSELAGEGLFGLASAFLHAGSPRVLASLWRVDDDATSALMRHFHEVWRRDDPDRTPAGAGAALRAAQEHVRTHPDHPEWAHPYYWAAWVLWGLPR